MLFKEYSCAGKADTYFIPSYDLPEHMEATEDRRRCYSDMVKEKKAGRMFYVKRWKEVESIKLPKDDDDFDLSEPCGDQVCRARLENMKLRGSRRETDQQNSGTIVPEIKIDRINPSFQRMKPTEWSFEAATSRRKTSDEIAEDLETMLSPCSTKVPDNAFVPVAPIRCKSEPVYTKAKEKEKKEKMRDSKTEQKSHKGLKFWRRSVS